MNNFYKKCAVIYDLEGKPLFVCDVLDFVNENDYKILKAQASSNLETKIKEHKEDEEKFKTEINDAIYKLAVAVKNYTNK